MSIIGDNIARLRKERGWTAAYLGRMAGYQTKSAVPHFESGNRVPGPDALQRIAGALGVPESELTEPHDPGTE